MAALFERSSGVLLHVTSLPGRFGIGDLGPAARAWVDWLAEAGCRYWQVLPLGPPGFGDSPYSSFSSFAGNSDLVSPEALVSDGLLLESELGPVDEPDRVDYRAVRLHRSALLHRALERLSGPLAEEFAAFRVEEAAWLEPYALYMAVKATHGDASWTGWPRALRDREPDALSRARRDLSAPVDHYSFGQFLFYRQLRELRRHASARGVQLIGDVPLYVAGDSVDVWLDPKLFTLDESGEPDLVAGVPPDMFSETGQRWETNPLYRWERHGADDFSWWTNRLEAFLRQADVLRIDHFTGLVTYYEIDAEATTALDGVWRPGPGAQFFRALEKRLGPLRVILEDLGPAGQVVEDLRLELGYPGMTVLQEAFGDDAGAPGLSEDRVVYTGTHDNDTARGRFDGETEGYQRRALAYTGATAATYPWGLVEAAWQSDGVIAVAPMQDLLGLGTEARMNHPSTTEGNWQWRMASGAASPELASRIADLNRRSDRT
jgi:4-alpha-glucanotransferase